jgi:hypothetical protein
MNMIGWLLNVYAIAIARRYDQAESVGPYLVADPITKKHAWFVMGALLEKFENEIQSQIQSHLSNADPQFRESQIFISLYMIGSSMENARATIFVICTDKNIRKKAKAAILKEGILQKFPEYTLASYAKPLEAETMPKRTSSGRDAQEQTDEDDSADNTEINDKVQVFYGVNRSSRLGTTLYASDKASDGLRYFRSATAGPFVHVGDDIYQLTVGHLCERLESRGAEDKIDIPTTQGGWELEDDSDAESDFESLIDVEITSQGSVSQSVSKSSSNRSDTSSEEADDNSRTPDASPPSNQNRATARSSEEESSGQLLPKHPHLAGEIAFHSSSSSTPLLDYLLVKSAETVRVDSLNTFQFVGDTGTSRTVQVQDFAPIPPNRRRIFVATGSAGVVKGVMFPGPTSWSPAGSLSFQKVYLVELDGRVQDGDCGSAVIDYETGAFYGQIVLGCPGTPKAYIVPSVDIIRDLRSRTDLPVEIRTNNKTSARFTPNWIAPIRMLALRIYARFLFILVLLAAVVFAAYASCYLPQGKTDPSENSPALSERPPNLDILASGPRYSGAIFDLDRGVESTFPSPGKAVYLPQECGSFEADNSGGTLVGELFKNSPFIGDDIVVTLAGCEGFCGFGSFYWDAGSRILTWILPVLLLLANIDLSTIDKRRFLSILHALGDPIDSFWSLIHKIYIWHRFYNIGLEKSGLEGHYQHKMDKHSRARIIATVLAGFEEIDGVLINSEDYYHHLVDLSPSLNGEGDGGFSHWRRIALELADSRTHELFRACLAIFIYLFGIAVLCIDAWNGRSTEGHTMIALLLSWLVPMVLLRNMIGGFTSRSTCLRIMRRFVSKIDTKDKTRLDYEDDQTRFIDSLYSGHYFEENQCAGNTYTYRPWKTSYWDRDPRTPPWLKFFTIALFSVGPVILGAAGAFVIVWHPLLHASYRRYWLLAILVVWIWSAATAWIMSSLLTKRRHSQIMVAKDIIVVGMLSIYTILLLGSDYFENCSCWSNQYSLHAAYVPLNLDPSYVEQPGEIYLIVAGVCIGLQLLLFAVVLVKWRHGLKVAWWSNKSRRREWEEVMRD